MFQIKPTLTLWQRITAPRRPASNFWRFFHPTLTGGTLNIACHDCRWLAPEGSEFKAIFFEKGRNCLFCGALCDSWR